MFDREARHESIDSEGNITTAASNTINNFEFERILYGACRSFSFPLSTTELPIFFGT